MIKYFRFGINQILWKISYTNLAMYLATIPTYEDDKEKEEWIEGFDQVTDFID
jgi:hypothetical protein